MIKQGSNVRGVEDLRVNQMYEGRLNSELLFCLINPASSAGQA